MQPVRCLLLFAVLLLVAKAAPPLQEEWSVLVPLLVANEEPVLPARIGPTPVFTASLSGLGENQGMLVGIALADGSLLWNTTGVIKSDKGVNYSLPYLRAMPLRPDAIVADYFAIVYTSNSEVVLWRGFTILHPKTGEVMVDQEVDPLENSDPTVFGRWNYLYIAEWGRDKAQLFRLEGPDYRPNRPAANRTFAGSPYVSSFAGLYPAPRQGLLLHAFHHYSPVHSTLTLECLDPTTLTPFWHIDGFDTLSRFQVSGPFEDVVVVSNSTWEIPAITELAGYSLASGQEQFRWRVHWKDASNRVILSFEGMAWDKHSGQTRMCTTLSTSTTDVGKGRIEWLTCIDPTNYETTLNVTLKVEGQQSNIATLMTIYERWALLKDEASGSLIALDCFSGSSTPAWTIAGQSELVRLSMSEDGVSFLMAVYRSGRITKWTRIQ